MALPQPPFPEPSPTAGLAAVPGHPFKPDGHLKIPGEAAPHPPPTWNSEFEPTHLNVGTPNVSFRGVDRLPRFLTPTAAYEAAEDHQVDRTGAVRLAVLLGWILSFPAGSRGKGWN